MLLPDDSAQLAALAKLDALLTLHDVPYWLFGGWAVDFHAGRVTREHGDIDIAIWEVDRGRLGDLLLSGMWSHRPDPDEDGSTCYQRASVRLEVAFLTRGESGDIYTPLKDGRGEWPEDSFGDEVRSLNGVRACLVSRASLIADKSVVRSDAVAAAKDLADVMSLSRVSGERETNGG